jgi:peroxiredoxin
MKQLIVSIIFAWCIYSINAQGYEIGAKAADFRLKNVDDNYVSLGDYPDTKGFIIVFTCNHCPFAQAYEDRIIAIHNQYSPKGIPVIAINPNDPEVVSADSFEEMKKRAKVKKFPYPYLVDETQEVYKKYGATRTPHVFVLKREQKDLIVSYIGTIDDNYQDASKVQKHYLADALDAILKGEIPDPAVTKAIGCTIKTKDI